MMASIAILLCQSPKKSDQPQIPADLPPGRCKEPEPRLVDHAHPLSSVGNRAKAWEHSWKPWPLKTLQVGWQSGWIQSYVHKKWISWNTDGFFLKENYMYHFFSENGLHHLWFCRTSRHSSIWTIGATNIIPAIRFYQLRSRILPMIAWWPLPKSHMMACSEIFVAEKNIKHTIVL